MSFTIEIGRGLLDEVRRIGAEEAAAAQADLLELDDRDPVEAVHDARKRCKKVRGLARLVRPALGDAYSTTNATFRDAARALSSTRDAHALLETFDHLVLADRERLPPGGLGAVRAELAARSEASTAGLDHTDERVGRAVELLTAGAELIDAWSFVEKFTAEPREPGAESHASDAHDVEREAIEAGIATTYGRGRDALDRVVDDPSAERFHELRKRAKYTWYHLRLLGDASTSILPPLADGFDRLASALGDAHDLAVLRDQLLAEPDAYGGSVTVEAAVAVADHRRQDLERRSLSLAHRLYVERPTPFARRIGGYWSCARLLGPEEVAGGIDDLVPAVDDPDDDLVGATVAELRRRAAAAGVRGRSTMRRDELLATLRAAAVG